MTPVTTPPSASARRTTGTVAKRPSHGPDSRRATPTTLSDDVLLRVREHFEAEDLTRRGICLLNAGRLDEAETVFTRAMSLAPSNSNIARIIISAYRRGGDGARAEAQAAAATRRSPGDVEARIRRAWMECDQGRPQAGIERLRAGLAEDPECADLHLQLGLMLASQDQFEEAELRFAQVTAIDNQRFDGWLNLALAQGALGRTAEGYRSLQRAQRLRPTDPTVALLMTQAFRAARDENPNVRLTASFPSDAAPGSSADIDELSRIAQHDPDFIDALLSVSIGQGETSFYRLLLETLERALARCPERAELHHHCGRVLERLGRVDRAIECGQRAVQCDPRCVRALVDLARWYRQASRDDDALRSLERIIAAGFEYADVYYQIGSLHQQRGEVEQAGSAYRHALTINPRYRAAQEALKALA